MHIGAAGRCSEAWFQNGFIHHEKWEPLLSEVRELYQVPSSFLYFCTSCTISIMNKIVNSRLDGACDHILSFLDARDALVTGTTTTYQKLRDTLDAIVCSGYFSHPVRDAGCDTEKHEPEVNGHDLHGLWTFHYAPTLRNWAESVAFVCLSSVRPYVKYLANNSRTQRLSVP